MADINVQRRGPGIWPWILGLILLALVVWVLAEVLGDDDPVIAERVEPVGMERPAPPAEGVRLVST
ncbi:MAG TPA: hypothetical protein VGR37_14905 [Longimicrobiaceae bacterium]|nr:hypothetical protein [Longimicrobiaceae bacterium]